MRVDDSVHEVERKRREEEEEKKKRRREEEEKRKRKDEGQKRRRRSGRSKGGEVLMDLVGKEDDKEEEEDDEEKEREEGDEGAPQFSERMKEEVAIPLIICPIFLPTNPPPRHHLSRFLVQRLNLPALGDLSRLCGFNSPHLPPFPLLAL